MVILLSILSIPLFDGVHAASVSQLAGRSERKCRSGVFATVGRIHRHNSSAARFLRAPVARIYNKSLGLRDQVDQPDQGDQ